MKKLLKKALIGFCVINVTMMGLMLSLRWINPVTSAFALRDYLFHGCPLYNLNQDWAPLDEITPFIIQTVVSGEDYKFFEHKGVHFNQLFYVFKKNLKKKTFGGSTITQQTIKNLFLFKERSYIKKAIEMYLACLLECFLSKERILEIYLNIIEFGQGLYGVNKASHFYFNKRVGDLFFDESCLLIGVLPWPSRITEYDEIIGNAKILYRASILYKMLYPQARQLNPSRLHSYNSRPCFTIL